MGKVARRVRYDTQKNKTLDVKPILKGVWGEGKTRERHDGLRQPSSTKDGGDKKANRKKSTRKDKRESKKIKHE